MASLILKTTPTLAGVAFRNDNDLGRDHSPSSNSTLNEKFSIHNTTPVTPGTRMAISYYGIGNGALRALPEVSDGSVSFSSVHQRPVNACLYNLLPFVLKHNTEDLSAGDRAKYGMRVPTQLAGEWYWAYYLRRIVVGNSENVYREVTVVDGVVTASTPYIYTSSNLSPTKPNFSVEEAIPSEGNFYEVIRPLDVSFTAADAALFAEAVELLYGTAANKGVISEMCIVAGYPNTVSLLNESKAPIAGTYVECLKAIVTDIFNVEATSFSAANEGIDLTIDIGATIPKSEQAI